QVITIEPGFGQPGVGWRAAAGRAEPVVQLVLESVVLDVARESRGSAVAADQVAVLHVPGLVACGLAHSLFRLEQVAELDPRALRPRHDRVLGHRIDLYDLLADPEGRAGEIDEASLVLEEQRARLPPVVARHRGDQVLARVEPDA